VRAILADTGALYALADSSDRYHQQSQAELDVINRDNLAIIVPYPVYVETHKLILYRQGCANALVFAKRLLTEANLLNPTSEDYQDAVQLIEQFPDQKITLVDAVLAVLALNAGVPVWTYDYHFDVMQIQVWR
jgi:predicted nucleic acid-binding protein